MRMAVRWSTIWFTFAILSIFLLVLCSFDDEYFKT
jgi:hypothetical protein